MGGLFPRASNAVHAVRVVKGGGEEGNRAGSREPGGGVGRGVSLMDMIR